MRRIIFILLLALLAGRAEAQQACQRIISLAPSTTEVVFDLGLGDRLVGVTRYCRYPKEAQVIPKIGGFYDMSLEGILALKPTDLIGLHEHSEILQGAKRFGVRSLEVSHSDIAGIKSSLTDIATTCHVEERAREIVHELTTREEKIRTQAKSLPPYRTLVVVGRTHEGTALSGVYVSGKDGVYSSVLALLGLKNVNSDATIAIPTLSPEGLIALAPEVIIEIVNVDDERGAHATADLWKSYPSLPAVKNDRVFVLAQDYASIPGPRYIELAEDIVRLLTKKGETT